MALTGSGAGAGLAATGGTTTCSMGATTGAGAAGVATTGSMGAGGSEKCAAILVLVTAGFPRHFRRGTKKSVNGGNNGLILKLTVQVLVARK